MFYLFGEREIGNFLEKCNGRRQIGERESFMEGIRGRGGHFFYDSHYLL